LPLARRLPQFRRVQRLARFLGLAGDDTFTLQNPSGSLFAPLGGIFFDGGGQAGDTFNNFGGAATFGTYSAAASSGVLQQNLGSLTQTITLTNLGSTPVTDLVSDVFLTVFGTLGPGDQRNGRRNRRRCADDAVQQSDLHQLPRRQ
jgi:hypothetical protein